MGLIKSRLIKYLMWVKVDIFKSTKTSHFVSFSQLMDLDHLEICVRSPSKVNAKICTLNNFTPFQLRHVRCSRFRFCIFFRGVIFPLYWSKTQKIQKFLFTSIEFKCLQQPKLVGLQSINKIAHASISNFYSKAIR